MIDKIISGDTFKLTLGYDGYDPALYDIWIALRGSSVNPIDIKPEATGVTINKTASSFDVTVSATATAAYTAGTYKYVIYMTKSGERYQVESGTVEIKPDFTVLTSTADTRSHVKKVLDAIEAVIESRATVDQMSYSIAGRSLSRTPIAELLKLRQTYRTEYALEVKAEKIAQGLGVSNQIRVRL